MLLPIVPVLLAGCIVVPVGDLLKTPDLEERTLLDGDGWLAKKKIALVEITGTISSSSDGGLLSFSEDTVSEVKARFNRIRNDPQVKAVVLRISSPGGEVTACDVLHHEVMELKKDTGLPVVASVGDLGTSGAYYIAAAADSIHAHPTSILGSIGVILHHFDASALLQKVGVAAMPVKSGEFKDLNSVFRTMSAPERKVLQDLVDDMYSRFVDVVVAGRSGLAREAVLELADGRVFSGMQARELGLIDGVGYLEDALEVARKRAGIEGATYVRYSRGRSYGAGIHAGATGVRPGAEVTLRLGMAAGAAPKLYYLWRPGL